MAIDRRGVTIDAQDTPIGVSPNPGLAIKAPCRAATTAEITLSGLQTVDGLALADGDRVLVKDQADQKTNGLYNAATGNWQRTIDADGNDKLTRGTQVVVTDGTVNQLSLWRLVATIPLVLGTSNITFVWPNALSRGQALTRTSDTNVVLTLGGSPSAALLASTSLTVSWSGALAASRGGFGADISALSGVPLFTSGVANFVGATGTGNFARGTSPTITGATLMSPAAITGVPDPTNAQDAATKNYVDTVAQGLDPKPSVLVATSANITLSGTQTIDGVAVVAGNRVLVKSQTAPSQNGIYVCAAGAWSRAPDADAWAKLPGAFVFVELGTVYAATAWVCPVAGGGTLGTTAITWSQFAGPGTFSAGSGLTLTGTIFSIAGNALTNAMAPTMGAKTIKGNNTAGTANQADLTVAQAQALLAITCVPQGRLTLATGVPVMTTDVAGATTVYYTPDRGRAVPIYNGSVFVVTDIGGELSQATTDTAKSPAAVTNNSNYDIFVWNDAGTIRATRGPAWSSDTSRGTGAGTTELQQLIGLKTNKYAISNGPGANLGTYVGTVRSNGSAAIDWKLGTAAANGGMATFGVWNGYNRSLVSARVSDTATSWPYAVATVRAANGSSTMRVNFVTGDAIDGIQAKYTAQIATAAVAGSGGYWGVALDSTTTFDERACGLSPVAAQSVIIAPAVGGWRPQLGFHFISANEQSADTNTQNYFGNTSGNCLQVFLMM